MIFNYQDLTIKYYWRYPNNKLVELKVRNPKTKQKEVLYIKEGKEFKTINIPDPKRKHTLCTINVSKGEEVIKEITMKATKGKKEDCFVKESGRTQSLRVAINELLAYPEMMLIIDDDKDFRKKFWDVYKDRFPKKKDLIDDKKKEMEIVAV